MASIELRDRLLSLHTAKLEERNGSYIIEIPSRELHQGDLQHEETYKVALFAALTSKEEPDQPQGDPKPPVQKDDIRVVEIEAIGQQGDRIAKVERGKYLASCEDLEGGEIDKTNMIVAPNSKQASEMLAKDI